MQVKGLSGIKSVEIIDGTGCKQESNRTGCKLQQEGSCQHTSQHFRAARTTHGQGESHDVRLTDPTYDRHLNSKPFIINLAKS